MFLFYFLSIPFAITAFENSYEIERSFEVYNTNHYCRLPKSITGKEIWSCNNHQFEYSTCEVLCPSGYILSSEKSTMSCECGDSSLDPSIEYPASCHWNDQDEVAHCVYDEDSNSEQTEEEFIESENIENQCVQLAPPINGTISCTNAFYENSLCKYNCENDPYEMIFPAESSQRKCICRDAENGKKGCYWTKNSQPVGSCSPSPEYFIENIELGCDALPEVANAYTFLNCDNSNNFESTCEYTCEQDFRISSIGRISTCDCYRKRGEYQCNWSRNLNKHCVPAPRWYRKFDRNYRVATKQGLTNVLADMDTLYDDVDQWANERSASIRRLRRKRSIMMSRRINDMDEAMTRIRTPSNRLL